jgi:hypothetical protein
MAMRKTGSRVVVVNGQRYRWRVRRSPTYMQGAYATALTFSVQREDGGSVLMIVADGPRPDNWLGRTGAVITPAVVADAIGRALAAGWQTGPGGKPFELALAPDAKPTTPDPAT